MTRLNPTVPSYPGQYSVFTAFLEPGDEAILFEPFFDQFLPSIVFNGGIPVYVPLHPPAKGIDKPTGHNWTIDFDELRLVPRRYKCGPWTEGSVSDVQLLPKQK